LAKKSGKGKRGYVDLGRPLIISDPKSTRIRYVVQLKESLKREKRFFEIRREARRKKDGTWCPIFKSGWLLQLPDRKDVLRQFFSVNPEHNRMSKFLVKVWKEVD
jgi:hypothetical protein